ncbi:MAG TPA: hypothetical protein VFW73_09495 [Lacipirellulaceae bacterium]|nr:hypothetical protein [Lacipirellulaceae bacterium]
MSFLLLATYAGIAILGDGLHSLLPEARNQHHRGIYVVTVKDESRHHVVGRFASVGDRGAAAQISSAGDTDAHICEICQFLFQSISQPAAVAAPIECRLLIVAVVALPQPIYAPASVGPQAPRGPPLFVA